MSLHPSPDHLAAVPPAVVFITSVTGLIDWQQSFYVISFVWVALQIYFRLRKEYGKWKAARAALANGGVLNQRAAPDDGDD